MSSVCVLWFLKVFIVSEMKSVTDKYMKNSNKKEMTNIKQRHGFARRSRKYIEVKIYH